MPSENVPLRRNVNDDAESSDQEADEDSDGSDVDDVDQPRISQWEDDEQVHRAEDKGEGSSKIRGLNNLKSGLSGLSFGSILKARRALDNATAEDESPSGEDSEHEESEMKDTDVGSRIVKEWSKQAKKRPNKHAPQELTSKRPVTRRRTVVEARKAVSRDPRFSSLSGEFSAREFRNQYAFLSDLHNEELSTLKTNLKRAKKMLNSSPRDTLGEREEEVARLERAVKRAESLVNKDRMDQIEASALEKVEKDEKGRQSEGKGKWWMKESAKKELLLRARHDALEASGGKQAVKKAIEKRQKKISQKEKKSRPSFVSRPERGSGVGLKRRPGEDSIYESRGEKRFRQE